MTTNQPPDLETRITRLETLFTNVGETVLAQNDTIAAISANVSAQSNTIDVLVANIQQLTENVAAVNQRVDSLTEQTTRNINNLAEQAAADRQQAAIDRQQTTIDRQTWQAEIQRIWEYLLNQSGNGRGNT